MKLFTVALFASSFTGVLASGRAAGWEAVLFYYAYLMDVGTGGDKIGPGCKGTHKTFQGACNFPEFIDHIQQKDVWGKDANGKRTQVGKFDPTRVPSSLKDLDFPDPEEASRITEWESRENTKYGFDPKVKDKYYKYSGVYSNGKLVEAADKAEKHSTIFKRIANRVQDARVRDTDSKMLAEFDKIKECLKVVRAGRMADNMGALPKAFDKEVLTKANKEYIKDEKYFLKASYTEANIGGFKYQDFDVDKTIDDIENNPKLTSKQISGLRDLVVDYVLDSDKKDILAHGDIIMDIEDIQSKFAGDPGVYCTV